ncbi:rhodanese-like domain-containing protein [Ekhidna sp. To15]|uniref:rhodanese-like domain-containing protein n=1 Tax=Ekhidna sp. To15 TaxID=3395267 RepID=UPI003F524871
MIRSVYFLLVLFSCSSAEQQGIEQIDAQKLLELQESGFQVVDIRTKREYDQGHIPGVLHIDYLSNDFMQKMEGQDKSTPLIIHCASGGRSGKAASALQKAGFKLIYDYSGGFSDWKSKGLEVE